MFNTPYIDTEFGDSGVVKFSDELPITESDTYGALVEKGKLYIRKYHTWSHRLTTLLRKGLDK